jgi:hypothetical protein
MVTQALTRSAFAQSPLGPARSSWPGNAPLSRQPPRPGWRSSSRDGPTEGTHACCHHSPGYLMLAGTSLSLAPLGSPLFTFDPMTRRHRDKSALFAVGRRHEKTDQAGSCGDAD